MSKIRSAVLCPSVGGCDFVSVGVFLTRNNGTTLRCHRSSITSLDFHLLGLKQLKLNFKKGGWGRWRGGSRSIQKNYLLKGREARWLNSFPSALVAMIPYSGQWIFQKENLCLPDREHPPQTQCSWPAQFSSPYRFLCMLPEHLISQFAEIIKISFCPLTS